MKLCMFHPDGHPLERGWVGRVDGDRVVHLAAQTLQSLFLGGGQAREHAEYPLTDVTLLVPVQHPPAVRLFEADGSFAFANPAAIVGPAATVVAPGASAALLRLAAVVGAEQAIGGYTLLVEVQAPSLPAPKDRDFGLVLGPVVVTPDEFDGAVETLAHFDWEAARGTAAANTHLRPGDLLGSPPVSDRPGAAGELVFDVPEVGVLRCTIGK